MFVVVALYPKTQFGFGYLEALLSVALWSIPLDDGFPDVQQEDVPKVEA